MKPFSIVLLGTQMATGGAQKVLLDQARWFHMHGHKAVAVFFFDKENLHQKWQENAEFPIHVMTSYRKNSGKLTSIVALFRGLWNLWRYLRHERFDVVEAFTHDSNILAMPLAYLAGVPIRIATHHGIIDKFPRWRERLHTWLVNNDIANVLVAVSEKTRQNAIQEGIYADRIVVIKNGILSVPVEGVDRLAIRKEVGLKEKDIFLISVGRLVYQKAHEFLIKAMPLVLEKHPNAKVIIFGEGVLRSQLEAQISALKLVETIRLFGNTDSIARYLPAADVFILPSRWEGLPIALLEAMSAGLPVVATDVEGVDDVLTHGEQGLLVPVGDSQALADAIVQLLSNFPRAHQMGVAARLHIMESYTEDIMCGQYLSLILKYLGRSQAV